LQEGDVIRLRLGEGGCSGSGGRQIYRKPLQLLALEAIAQIRTQVER
jgi:hypothetical protein